MCSRTEQMNIGNKTAVVLRYVILAFLMVAYSSATSVVAKLEKHRIILAADTRQDRLDTFSGKSHHSFHDDGCKILPLGTSAIAVSGNVDYKRNDPADGIPDWDALSDARAAYTAHGQDLQALADDWARRGAMHYNDFYVFAANRVRELAGVNSDRILLDAFFVGWEGRPTAPIIIWEKVYLDENSLPVVRTSFQKLSYRELPYTTNFTTQQLIEGDSDRTRTIATKWKSQSLKIVDGERDWRSVEFLIRATGEYEESVGQKVDVLEIPSDGQAEWLQNITCPK
jgi:hypothetical protein